MTQLQFTNFDYIVIGVMVFSCVFAFCRGLVREILSLAAWLGAGIVTIYYFQPAAEKLQTHFKSPVVAAAIAGFGLYIVALIGFSLINVILMKSFKSSKETGMLDNMLGLLFGAARGALIISLGFFLITVALPDKKEYPQWLQASITRPYVEQGAAMLARVAPQYLFELSSLERKAQGVATTTPAADADNPNKPAVVENNGYNQTTTKQLDRLINSTGNQ